MLSYNYSPCQASRYENEVHFNHYKNWQYSSFIFQLYTHIIWIHSKSNNNWKTKKKKNGGEEEGEEEESIINFIFFNYTIYRYHNMRII